jgi:hypothetical protein
MARELDKMARDAKYMQDDRVQINQLNDQLLQNFQLKVPLIVEDIRKEKGLWIIFALATTRTSPPRTPVSISREVIKRLDATIKN